MWGVGGGHFGVAVSLFSCSISHIRDNTFPTTPLPYLSLFLGGKREEIR